MAQSWFARCFPKAAPPPPAPPPARRAPTPARKPRTSFELPSARSRASSAGDQGEEKGGWWAFALALATLAILSRKLALSSQTNDAVCVFISIGLLQLWLKHRSAGAHDAEPAGAAARVGGREHRSSCSLASEAEGRVIVEIKRRLRTPPTPPGLAEDDELLDVQLLRFVREHGCKVSKVEGCFRKMLAWKAKIFKDSIYDPLRQHHDEQPGGWLSSMQMPHGAWVRDFVAIGTHAGMSNLGNPVKIERIGQYDVRGIQKISGGTDRLNVFYLGLVEHLCRRLDYMSVQEGRLQQTYEIFDLRGLSMKIVSLSTIKFTQDVLLAFSTHYPSSFRKAVVINAPPSVGGLWKLLSKVLPASVNAKVNILDQNYAQVLQKDLTPEALRWLESTNDELNDAPHRVEGGEPAAR